MKKPHFALMALGLALGSPLLGAQPKGKPLSVELQFVPQENITAANPRMDPALTSTGITLLPIQDGRGSDGTLVGENFENEANPIEVRTQSNVAEFVSRTLRQSLMEWHVRLQDSGGLVLSGEVLRLFVTERNFYVSEASIRFRLQDQAGQFLWEGTVSGQAKRWGRSLSAENYNEEISDCLKKAYAALVSDKGFQAAWAGRPKTEVEGSSVTAAVLKQKVMSLMNEEIGTSVIVDYVRSQRVQPPISAEEIVDWKRSGVAEPVIAAVVRGTSS